MASDNRRSNSPNQRCSGGASSNGTTDHTCL